MPAPDTPTFHTNSKGRGHAVPYPQNFSIADRKYPTHSRNSPTGTNSPDLCATVISPGPNTTVSRPGKCAASVPNETVVALLPDKDSSNPESTRVGDGSNGGSSRFTSNSASTPFDASADSSAAINCEAHRGSCPGTGLHSTVILHSPALIFFADPPRINPAFNVVYGGSKSRFF